MKKIITVFLGALLTIFSRAQSYTVKLTPSILHLYNSKNEIAAISNNEKFVLFPLNVVNQQAKFKLIKNKNGLFALVDGTGQVYKASKKDQNRITFTRIDSSHFFGNTFLSINFSYKETIYSF